MLRAVVVAGVLVAGAGAVFAQQAGVEEARNNMKSMGRALGGTLSPMAKGEKPYDQAAVDTALNQLEEGAKKLPMLFPASLKGAKFEGDYSPSPKIWDDKAGFDGHIASFSKVVTETKGKIKDLDTLKASVGAIGKQCGGCHETYRVKNS